MPHDGLRRTSLYASGANPSHMIQTQFYDQDCIVYDLEDSVPLEEKDAARILIYQFLKKHRPEDKQIVIRVNAIDSVFFAEDIEACVRLRPDAIRLPKVESADEVKKVDARIGAIEKEAGIPQGSVKLWCNIESYMGVLNAREIAKASPRIVAMAVSAEDFTASMKAQRTKEGWEIFHARNAVLMACRETGIDALDAVFSDFNDAEGLKADAEWGKRLGFDGKTLIHPKQVDIVNAVFTPSPKEIDQALRVLDAIEKARAQKKGAASLDGSMLDEAVLIRARRVMALAKASEIRIEGVEAVEAAPNDAREYSNPPEYVSKESAAKNGREIPDVLWGLTLKPYAGPFATPPGDSVVASRRTLSLVRIGESKMRPSIAEAIKAAGLADGMTISFHHSFREGDRVIGQTLAAIRELGIKNLTFAPSAVVNIKNPSIVDYVKDGTISRIEASGIRGELGDAVLSGEIDVPVILRPHGARPRAIEAGELNIDVAFIGASAADEYGNATGLVGPNACGSLGYSFIDARAARKTVIITDHLAPYPCIPASISQEYADYVVKIDRIGDSELIGKGAARLTRRPRDLVIAELVAKVIEHSGFFREGYSFQTGASAIAIACTQFLADKTAAAKIKAGFALGGLTASIVEMFDRGLIGSVHASQCFDSVAARSVHDRPNIVEIDNSVYSNIHNKGCMVNKLDIGVLGALEVDLDFNVNILTGSSGEMMGGLGGGPDVAGGAEVSIVALPIVRGRTASVVKKVFTLCTPGETVAVVVTEAGIALNPRHRNYAILRQNLAKTKLKLVPIEDLHAIATGITGEGDPIPISDKIACIVQYRDGTVIDTIRRIRKA